MAWRDFSVDHAGRRIAVRDYGGDGPALLLLHGGGGNVAGWDTLAPHLVPELSVVAYDAVGHGASGWGEPFRELVLDEVEALCARLSIEEPVLVGSSMGGLTAQRYAAHGRACRGIVAIDGALALTRDEAARPRQTFDEFAAAARDGGWGFAGGAEEAEAWVEDTVGREPPPFEAHVRRSLQPRADGTLEQRPTIEHAYAMRIAGEELPPEDRTIEIYERISCPVLLLNATRGSTGAGAYTDEQRARLDELPARHSNILGEWVDAGHLIHWEKPRLVANRIRDFVRDARA